MARLEGATAERLTQYFTTYLFQNYRGSRHVRRIAPWLGLIALGLQRLGAQGRIPRVRQFQFDYRGYTFKAKFDHQLGVRGGIQIIQVLPGRGSPEGEVAFSVESLGDAERFYSNSRRILNRFVNRRR
jgi:hypothetical protein